MAFAYPRLTPRVITPPINPENAETTRLFPIRKPGPPPLSFKPGLRPPSASRPGFTKPGPIVRPDAQSSDRGIPSRPGGADCFKPGSSTIRIEGSGVSGSSPRLLPKFGPPGMVSQAAGPPLEAPNNPRYGNALPKFGPPSLGAPFPSYAASKFGPPGAISPSLFPPPKPGANLSSYPTSFCEFCKATKPVPHFYTAINCSAHSYPVCYTCITATKAKYCPACPREYSQQEREFLRLKLRLAA